jgi:hypothetical protein
MNALGDTGFGKNPSFTKNIQHRTSNIERQSFHSSAIERRMFDVFFISSNCSAFL